jgi:hypothetical protein
MDSDRHRAHAIRWITVNTWTILRVVLVDLSAPGHHSVARGADETLGRGNGRGLTASNRSIEIVYVSRDCEYVHHFALTFQAKNLVSAAFLAAAALERVSSQKGVNPARGSA